MTVLKRTDKEILRMRRYLEQRHEEMRGQDMTRSCGQNMRADGATGMRFWLDVTQADAAKQRDQVDSWWGRQHGQGPDHKGPAGSDKQRLHIRLEVLWEPLEDSEQENGVIYCMFWASLWPLYGESTGWRAARLGEWKQLFSCWEVELYLAHYHRWHHTSTFRFLIASYELGTGPNPLYVLDHLILTAL